MKDWLKKMKLNEQKISMVLGVIVVVLVAGLLVKYFKSVNRTGETSSTATVQNENLSGAVSTALPSEYQVATGDSLWTIAEKTYDSGYNWVDIYAANKTTIGANPNRLLVGTKLTLPQAETKKVEVIQPVTYTTVAGDNLWNVAAKNCGSGYDWVHLARENGLKNPNYIVVGQTLKLICN